MDSQASNGKLDLKISVTLKRLDQLLALLDGYKPVLEHNATCAAVEIKANFDGLMDAVYQRQLGLLKQLDKVYKEKLALIDSSKQTIEALRSGIVSCVSTRHSTDSRIYDYITRSESVLLNSSSAPFVSFRAERSTLPQAIANYGRVVSRYSGHFADPSQPSSCLPLPLEEEDDHEESQEHADMFCHVAGSYSYAKPHWRQWLFNGAQEFSSADSDKGESHILSALWNTNLKEPKDTITRDVNTLPSCCSDVPWMNQFITSKRHQLGRDFVNSSGISLRRRSDAENSDHTVISTSDSFTVLTGSPNVRMDDLKDWLLCDPSELGDIPGFSASLSSMRQKRNDTSVPFASFFPAQMETSTTNIKPNVQTAATGTSISSLLPAHLLNSGPLDLTCWLQPQPEPTSGRVERENEPIPQASMDTTLEKPAETVEAPRMKQCPYAQCIGGPGGPTCCGARLQCPSADELSAVEMTAAADNGNFPVPPREPALSNSCLSGDSVVQSNVNLVVSQLNQIAATHWSKWVGNQATDGATNTTKACPVFAIKSWLQPSAHTTPSADQQDLEDLALYEDPVLPPKRRITEKGDPMVTVESSVVVQSPFVCLTDPVEFKGTHCSPKACSGKLSQSLCPPGAVNSVPSHRSNEIKEDCGDWLLEKMSKLSTASEKFPIGVDKWLLANPSTPSRTAETRWKPE